MEDLKTRIGRMTQDEKNQHLVRSFYNYAQGWVRDEARFWEVVGWLQDA